MALNKKGIKLTSFFIFFSLSLQKTKVHTQVLPFHFQATYLDPSISDGLFIFKSFLLHLLLQKKKQRTTFDSSTNTFYCRSIAVAFKEDL